MNKNSKARRSEALKAYAKGDNSTSFLIPKSLPGKNARGWRTQTISFGGVKRKSTKAKVAAKSPRYEREEG
jgi:hypothetical protein